MSQPDFSDKKHVVYTQRQQIFRLLSGLHPAQFDELIFILMPPSGVVSDNQPQGKRTKELLSWAESTTGPGLQAVGECLEKFIPDSVIPDLNNASTANYITVEVSQPKEILKSQCQTGRRTALLIGVSKYGQGFAQLPAAKNDVEALQRVLNNPDLGGFKATPLIDPDVSEMEGKIRELFLNQEKDDLALLFFSGHGIKDDEGVLCLSTKDTCKNRDRRIDKTTVVSIDWIREVLNQSSSGNQVLILDCCSSGAFAENLISKGSSNIDFQSQLAGQGRVILTSSASSQDSFQKAGMKFSIYTNFILEGILSGKLGRENNLYASVHDLHQYVRYKVQSITPAMNPRIYTDEIGQDIQISKILPNHISSLSQELKILYSEVSFVPPALDEKLKKLLILSTPVLLTALFFGINSWVSQRDLRQYCMDKYEAYLGANEDIIKKFSNKDDPERIKCEKLGIYF